MQELVQGGFLLLVDILLVEMAEVMMDDDCLSRWEGRMQLQIEHLNGEYFDPHPDASPSWLVES